MANAWHVPYELLNPETQDMARAIQSLMEELEAIDWYNQRAQITQDESLRQILEHNRDEEKEHASMLLEWIRRRDQTFDAKLRGYLFKSADILELEESQEGDAARAAQESKPALESSAAQESAAAVSGQTPEPTPAFTVGSLRPARG